MAEVVLTSRERGWFEWAGQFDAASRERFKVVFEGADVLGAYRRAARRATNGILLVSVGHGGGSDLSTGMVDLAPAGALRIATGHLEVPVERLLSPADRALVQTFHEIGEILRQRQVRRVIFISCNVGNSMHFLGEIANRWRVTVVGYRKRIQVAWIEERRRRTYYVYLEGKAPTADEEIAWCSRNYPPIDVLGDAWSLSPGTAGLRASRL